MIMLCIEVAVIKKLLISFHKLACRKFNPRLNLVRIPVAFASLTYN